MKRREKGVDEIRACLSIQGKAGEGLVSFLT